MNKNEINILEKKIVESMRISEKNHVRLMEVGNKAIFLNIEKIWMNVKTS